MGNYDEFATDYARLTAEQEKETRNKFRSLLPDLSGKTLLDVGCGSGEDSIYYSQNGARVSGIDISKEEIRMARDLGTGDFAVGDMNALRYEPDSFDVVTSVYALQASDDVTCSLEEMIRVAKQGAPIVVLVKHPIRNFLESMVNERNPNYQKMGDEEGLVTSRIFNGEITLHEPGHKIAEYLSGRVLSKASLEHMSEHYDFPVSEQVIEGANYPTYMILKFRKR